MPITVKPAMQNLPLNYDIVLHNNFLLEREKRL